VQSADTDTATPTKEAPKAKLPEPERW